MNQPFSFVEIAKATHGVKLKDPHFLMTSDGTQLAYYSFVPPTPKALLLFYHGGGIWSNKLYHYLAYNLSEHHNIAVYLADIRGHGNSSGNRGDAPSAQRVWQDVDEMIAMVTKDHPNIPFFVGGHSSGAGLVLNHSGWKKNDAIRAYIFLAPYLGPQSGTFLNKPKSARSFVKKVRTWALVLHALSGGRLLNHMKAIFFNYPARQAHDDARTVLAYTCAMARATAPHTPKKLFANLAKPCAIFIGDSDEQFSPQAVLAYEKYLMQAREKSITHIVPNATHLSIVCDSINYVNEAIDAFI